MAERSQPNIAGAIYGTILSTAVIATLSEDASLGPIQVAAWTAATAVVFWLAHAYSRIVAAGISRPRGAKHFALNALREEWPMVQGAFLPILPLFLAPLGLVSEETAENIAIADGIAVLFVVGLIVGRKERMGLGSSLIVATINALFGLVIVGLKIFVH